MWKTLTEGHIKVFFAIISEGGGEPVTSPPFNPALLYFTTSGMSHFFTVHLWCKCLSLKSDLFDHLLPYLHLAASEMRCWSGGRGILIKKISVLQHCVLL